MARITLVTNGHVCTNPRVWKEADALADHGHDVALVGIWYDERHAVVDAEMRNRKPWRHIVAADLRASRLAARILRSWHGIRSRAAQALVRNGVDDPHVLGYAANRILQCAVEQRADLTIGHLEVGLWAVGRLARKGQRIGADFEDWHSENGPGLPEWRARYYRKVESRAARAARHLTTTSRAMSSAIAISYGVKGPSVIYNGNGALSCDSDRVPDGPLRMLWFSQTIGMGRGLEDLFRALPLLVGEWRLELIGFASAETRRWIDRQIPRQNASRVSITPPVHPLELAALVQGSDIGLALEVPNCRNRDLTISNKIVQYLQCGIKVAATDTTGQREALGLVPGGGELYLPGDFSALAAILNPWIADPTRLRAARGTIRSTADQHFAYERQVPLLLASVESALRGN